MSSQHPAANIGRDLPAYPYSRLVGAHDIRLLDILPGEESRADPLRCKLSIVSLEKPPVYEAISYTWGSSELEETILVEGSQSIVRITANAAAALYALRQPNRTRTVWIDGVCVNQLASDDRSHQVSIMGWIFQRAFTVILYLGEVDEDFRGLESWCTLSHGYDDLERLREIEHDATFVMNDSESAEPPAVEHGASGTREPPSKQSVCPMTTTRIPDTEVAHQKSRQQSESPVETVPCDGTFAPDINFDDISDSTSSSTDGSDNFVPPESARLAENVRNFFRRPWFNRAWVIQEVLLARHCVVYCGHEPISWASVCTLYSRFVRKSETHDMFGLQDTDTDWARKHRALAASSSMLQSTGAGHFKFWRLFDIMCDTAQSQCHDPRDKLFSLLSLFDESIPPLLQSNYQKDTKAVYTDLTRYFIKQDENRVLSIACHGMSQFQLPSWVVDWQQLPSQLAPLAGTSKVASWRAGYAYGLKQIAFGNPPDTDSLLLRGRLVSRLAFVGSPMPTTANENPEGSEDQKAKFYKNVRELEEQILMLQGRARTTQQRANLHGTLIYLRSMLGMIQDDSDLESISRLNESMRQHTEGAEDACQMDPSQRSDHDDEGMEIILCPPTHQKHHICASRMDCCAKKCWGRTLVLSHSGMTGLAPAQSQIGDHICVLIGFNTPFIIRPIEGEGKSWSLVGEARIEGIMEGQAIDDLDMDTLLAGQTVEPLVDICLR